MKELSEREIKLIKTFLHDAYAEGGRGLWLVAKKYVMTSYWFHMLRYEGRAKEYTMWNVIRRLYGYNGYKPGHIYDNIKCEVAACIYPWEQVDDDNQLWDGNYRGFKIKTILDKNILSMKQFYLELNELIQRGKEEIDLFNIMNVNIPLPAIDAPI